MRKRRLAGGVKKIGTCMGRGLGRRDLAEELTGKKWSWVGRGLWRSTVVERETGPGT